VSKKTKAEEIRQDASDAAEAAIDFTMAMLCGSIGAEYLADAIVNHHDGTLELALDMREKNKLLKSAIDKAIRKLRKQNTSETPEKPSDLT
jgi:ribosome-associated translation inhibitor RaiA